MNIVTERQPAIGNRRQSAAVVSGAILFLFVTFGVEAVSAQDGGTVTISSPTVSNERMFFPRGFVRGFVEFDVAPPHNEIDLGFCKDSRVPGATCTAFARYVWTGNLELQPFGRKGFRRLYVIYAAKLFEGSNVPQLSYTASMAPILWEQNLGVGVQLPKGFQLRLVEHNVHALGKYMGTPGTIDLSPNGPYGLNTRIGLRWNFGGRRIFEE